MVEDSLDLPEALAVQQRFLETALGSLGLAATAEQQARLLGYLALMLRWNRSYNLTAVTKPREMVARHLIDSLAVLPHLDGVRYLDAGTGPGLPGIPLAILRPEWEFDLLDSNGKKVRFLNEARRQLKLDNINPLHMRLEAYRPSGDLDGVLARALAPLDRLVVWLEVLLDRGVPLLAMKGDLSESERRAVPAPYNVALTELKVPGLHAQRCLVRVEKQ
ncbi:MAG: 16S rRNA (guanine(527)-N(7))-methyltransferase RsmG [Wenzhouxiangella sp.]|jgi:16S rRNA (guanine527-N7)-methyltransferase|nr:16S rRNA (guanine(527)-N(7))-methyltransferase RsmG [Wenzhouxiangella sp.]